MKPQEQTKFTLKTKFVVTIAILVAVVVFLNSYNRSCSENELLTTSMDESGILLSSTLAIAFLEPMIRVDSIDVFRPYIERIMATGHDVYEVSVIDIDGKYVAHRVRDTDLTKLNQMIDPALLKSYNSFNRPVKLVADCEEQCFVDYVAPIQIGSTRFGTIILRFTLDRLFELKNISKNNILILAMISLLAGLILSVVLAQLITRGLDNLIVGTQIIEAGDLSHRIQKTSRDEIGTLADRFNTMLDSLENNNKMLDRKIYEIETLFKASQAMNFQSDTDKLIKQILEMAGKAIKAERCSIMLQTDSSVSEIETKIVYSFNKNEIFSEFETKPVKIKSGEGIAGIVLKTGNSMIVNEGHKDPLFKSFDSKFEGSIQNLISVPLKIKERVTGVINGVNRSGGTPFTDEDQRLLEALAQQAAMAVEHARLYELAITDGLTKLYIHRFFQARLEEEIVRAKRYHTVCSLILFDIDHFKKFNDTYGHQQGDIVLIEVAKIVKDTVRDTIDVPARYGGEEFAVILPETDVKGAHMLAERLRKNVEAYDFPGQEKALKVTISLGVSTFPDHASTKNVLIEKADIALYKCKESGRNCSFIYNDSFS